MTIFDFTSYDEKIAQQMTSIGLQLHIRGYIEPYCLVIEARNMVLDVLDRESNLRICGEDRGKNKTMTEDS